MTLPVRRKLLFTVAVIALALAVSAPALAGNGGFAPVPPESPNAEGITQSYWFVSVFALAIFLLVEGLLVAFVIRYRRKRRPRDADGVQIHGSNRLELSWTIGPVVILFLIAVFVLVKLPGIADVPGATAGGGPLEIEVVGQQFAWEYRYPNGVVAIDHLRAPAGRPVRLEVTAPDWDVVHSWWIPALGGKIDAIPGRTTSTWFEADRTGTYKGQCAELCGLYHAKMLAQVEVLDEAAFDSWLAAEEQEQQVPSTELGREEWVGFCAKCHGLDGGGGYGPPLARATLTDAETIERVTREGRHRPGRKVMPPVGRDWTREQMDSLNAYLEERFGNQS
jgi:cytochrome c oxidase subunit II